MNTKHSEEVVVTESNTSFVKVGEKTHICYDGHNQAWLWSEFCKRYERLGWAETMWCVQVSRIQQETSKSISLDMLNSLSKTMQQEDFSTKE